LPKRLTFSQFHPVPLKLSTIQLVAIHPIVPTMEGNAMVIDYPGSVY
jgi:hypothetical protein